MLAATVDVIHQFNSLPEEEKPAAASAIREANEKLFPSDNKGKTKLWTTLLVGLFILAAGAIVAAVVIAFDGGDSTAYLLIATAVVSGVIGLFSTSPVQR